MQANTAGGEHHRPDSIVTATLWGRLIVGLVSIFLLLQSSAQILGSDRGQAGVIVGILVVAATLAVERVMFGRGVQSAARSVGLGRPHARGLAVAGGICVVLLLIVPVFARVMGTGIAFFPMWWSLLPGLFAQAGVAEEVLFRGYLFGHLRRGRTFSKAAWLSMLPFVGVHLLLFLTMPWPLALASLVLAFVLLFPLAHLFELGGSTIWPPALLHFVVQGTVRVIVFPDTAGASFPLVWIAASAILPCWFS